MKSHSYQASFTNTCRFTKDGKVCGRPEVDHTNLAQCESCSYSGDCDVFPATGMLLCPACYQREQNTPTTTEPVDPKRHKIVELLNQLDKNIAMDNRAFFVGRVDAIADIQMQLEASGMSNAQAELESVKIVASMLEKLQERINSHVRELTQMRTEAIADQRYLTMMVPKLREEAREEFKKFDISYKPSPAIPAVAHVKQAVTRKSSADRTLESLAAAAGVTPERYRAIQAANIAKVLGVPCTCAETPGMCRIHPR